MTTHYFIILIAIIAVLTVTGLILYIVSSRRRFIILNSNYRKLQDDFVKHQHEQDKAQMLLEQANNALAREEAQTETLSSSLKKETEKLTASIAETQGLKERIALQEVMIQTLSDRETTLQKKIDDTLTRLEIANSENSRLSERLEASATEQIKAAQQAETRFKNLAAEIMDANSRRFNEQSHEQLAQVLNPLKDDIEKFKKSIADAYGNEARERFTLSERIKELVQLNENIGREAKELTRALRGDSKVQGDWGEMILERLLEKSGLIKGVHFELQVTRDENGITLKSDNGSFLRPDAVINYPDGRCVVVDSKVSLTGYIDMVNNEVGSTEYLQAADRHLRSIKSHIKELATKKYQDIVGNRKTDFVTMFIPNEGAYIAAMQLDNHIWEEAYDQRVLIVSPTHLISVLRLIEQMWKQDDTKRYARDIADEGGKMYDKFVGFLDDMAAIEKSLSQMSSSYSAAMNKLSEGKGNLLSRAQKMKKLGAKATKSINTQLIEKAQPDEE